MKSQLKSLFCCCIAGDVYLVRLANAPTMGAYLVQSFGHGEPVSPAPFPVQIVSKAPFKSVEVRTTILSDSRYT